MSLSWDPVLFAVLKSHAYKNFIFVAAGSWCEITSKVRVPKSTPESPIDDSIWLMEASLVNLQGSRFCSATFTVQSEYPTEDTYMYQGHWDASDGCYYMYSRNAQGHQEDQLCVAELLEAVDAGSGVHAVKEQSMNSNPLASSAVALLEESTQVSTPHMPPVEDHNSWASMVEEDLESKHNQQVEGSIVSSSIYSGSDNSEQSILSFSQSEINIESVSRLAFILLDFVVIKPDIEIGRGISCQEWDDHNKRERSFASLDLLHEPWKNGAWIAWYMDLQQPFERMRTDADFSTISSFTGDFFPDVDETDYSGLPYLAKYIPQNIGKDFHRHWNSLPEQYRSTIRGHQHALGSARWEHMVNWSQHIQHQKGYGIRQGLEKADRSVDWFWTSTEGESLDKYDPRKLGQSSTSVPTTRITTELVHHLNYCGNPVYSKSATPPEVSLWAAYSQTINHASKDESTYLSIRKWVLASEAGKLLDPFTYDGPEELIELNSQFLRDAVTGYVQKVYVPRGTWDMDDYTLEEDAPMEASVNRGWFDSRSGGNCPLPSYRMDEEEGDMVVNDDGRLHPVIVSKTRESVKSRSTLYLVQNIKELPQQRTGTAEAQIVDIADLYFNEVDFPEGLSEASTEILESVFSPLRIDDSQSDLLDEVSSLSVESENSTYTSHNPPKDERLKPPEDHPQAKEDTHAPNETSTRSGDGHSEDLGADKKDNGDADVDVTPFSLSFQLSVGLRLELKHISSEDCGNQGIEISETESTEHKIMESELLNEKASETLTTDSQTTVGIPVEPLAMDIKPYTCNIDTSTSESTEICQIILESIPYINYSDISEIPCRPPSFPEFLFGSFAIAMGKKALGLFRGK